jgi:hypothetical protein
VGATLGGKATTGIEPVLPSERVVEALRTALSALWGSPLLWRAAREMAA